MVKLVILKSINLIKRILHVSTYSPFHGACIDHNNRNQRRKNNHKIKFLTQKQTTLILIDATIQVGLIEYESSKECKQRKTSFHQGK